MSRGISRKTLYRWTMVTLIIREHFAALGNSKTLIGMCFVDRHYNLMM